MKCGVLIIGSLYWDKHQNENTDLRINWRKNRLNINENIHVFAPIRYGRLSGKKDATNYTMVLSKEIEKNNQHGTAYLIPFKNQINSFRGLFNQAQFLSEAENADDKKLVKGNEENWCIIGLLFNQNFNQEKKNSILSKWCNRLIGDGIFNNYLDYHIGEEASIINNNGEIQINWIKAVNPLEQTEVDKYDIIMATCIKPKVKEYPDFKLIYDKLPDDKRNYFFNNIQHGITTFQDRDIILEIIKNCK